MNKIVYILTLILLTNFISCKKETKSKTYATFATKSNFKDSIAILLAKAINMDTLEFEKWEPFLFLKSGKLLSEKEKNAVVLYSTSDSTYTIELYTLQNKKWIKNDTHNKIEANPIQFYISFNDYNFDNQNDIYIQETASNGFLFSRGHLLTVNPKTKKLKEHQETRTLANMTPDTNRQIIYTDELDTTQIRKVNKRINKWENGKLIPFEIEKSKEVYY